LPWRNCRNHPVHGALAEISDGVTILTASTAEQYADEENGAGVFTSLFVDALGGAAANLVGEVTPRGRLRSRRSVTRLLGAATVFKTNVKRFVSLRKVRPPLELNDLQRISEFFQTAGFQYQLDPSYEPERQSMALTEAPDVPPPDPRKTQFSRYFKNTIVGFLWSGGRAAHVACGNAEETERPYRTRRTLSKVGGKGIDMIPQWRDSRRRVRRII
jgi:hypothetical protein